MLADADEVRAICRSIYDAESAGDRVYLSGILAPELAFLRANGTVDDAERYLQKVAPSAPRESEPAQVEILGKRAIAKCVIRQSGRSFHNLHLFARISGSWKLLAWANEEIA